jgi:hypothetical protein
MNRPADDGFRRAASHAPGGLYKYRRFELDEDRDRVKRALQFGEIYFPSRLELNDPFELQVAFRLHPDNQRVVQGLLESVQRGGATAQATVDEVRAVQSRIRGADPNALRRAVQEGLNRLLESRCYVFCTCAKHDDLILWAHYADSHKGICIGFDSLAHPFDQACAIDYGDQFPITPFPRIEGAEDALYRNSALSKSVHWKYEDEYRLCSLRIGENPTWHLDLSWPAPQLAKVNPRTIKRVYLGARMSEPRREELIGFCRRERPDVKLYKCAASAERYELTFTEL